MIRSFLLVLTVSAASVAFAASGPTVRVQPSTANGPLQLKDQTASAAIRSYLQSWKAMSAALDQNRVSKLSPDFVGTAQEKLTNTIHEQTKLGIRSRYRDQSHDLQIVFYSPEGLSIQLIDHVEYDEQVFKGGKTLANRRVRARYIVVLTPGATRWRVRIFQAQPE